MLELGDEYYMKIALNEARKAADIDEVPVGCVITGPKGGILGKAHNLREKLQDPTAHAEMLAITQAAEALGTWRLEGTTLYVTLEPCPMCAGAALNARISKIVFGADDPQAGAVGSACNFLDRNLLNHRVQAIGGIMAEECRYLLNEFFKKLRNRKTGKKS